MLSTHPKRQILGCTSEAAAPQGLAGPTSQAALRIWVLASVAGLISLGACGQKGPLYLPETAPTAASPANAGGGAPPNSATTGDGNNLNNRINPAVTR